MPDLMGQSKRVFSTTANRKWRTEMEIGDVLGDYLEFYLRQASRLTELGIDIADYEVSHLAFRVETYREYVGVRDNIETHCVANVENVWNGRPISKLLLRDALDLGNDVNVSLIELIPPVHRSVNKIGLEHVGIVLGDAIDEFARIHKSVLTGQQFQSEFCDPYLITFDDRTTVKLYRYSLMDVCIKEGHSFDGFYHVDDWSGGDC